MSFQAVAWAIEVRVGDPILKNLLMAICHHADRETWSCWPSQDTLAYETEVSKRTIQRKLEELEERGFLRIEKRRNPDGTQANSILTLTGGQAVTLQPPVDKNAPTGGQKPGSPGDTTCPPVKKQEEQEEQSIGAVAPSADLEKQFFDRAVQVITGPPNQARSTAAILLKACGKDIAKARSALEQSVGRSNPKQWIFGHITYLKKQAAEPSDNTVFMNHADDSRVLL